MDCVLDAAIGGYVVYVTQVVSIRSSIVFEVVL